MRPILRRMAGLGLVPFIHTFAGCKLEAPWRLEVLANEFPEVVFVDLNPFTDFEQSQQVLQIGKRTRNILFDTTAVPWPDWFFRQVLETLGPERVVFGSDLYSPPFNYTWCRQLEELRRAGIPADDLRNILGGNIKRLFGLS